MDIELGRTYRDTVTGLIGVAVSKTEFLHSCTRVAIQPREIKDGKIVDLAYFDDKQLVLEPSFPNVLATPVSSEEKTGGNGPAVPRAPDVKR